MKKNLVACRVNILALATLLTFGLGGCSESRLTRAETLLSKGAYNESLVLVGEEIMANPENAEAFFLKVKLTFLMDDRGSFVSAVKQATTSSEDIGPRIGTWLLEKTQAFLPEDGGEFWLSYGDDVYGNDSIVGDYGFDQPEEGSILVAMLNEATTSGQPATLFHGHIYGGDGGVVPTCSYEGLRYAYLLAPKNFSEEMAYKFLVNVERLPEVYKERFATSKLIPKMLLEEANREADRLAQTGERGFEKDWLEELVKEYPNTPEASSARERLIELR